MYTQRDSLVSGPEDVHSEGVWFVVVLPRTLFESSVPCLWWHSNRMFNVTGRKCSKSSFMWTWERSLVGFYFCHGANVLYIADKGVNKTTVYCFGSLALRMFSWILTCIWPLPVLKEHQTLQSMPVEVSQALLDKLSTCIMDSLLPLGFSNWK